MHGERNLILNPAHPGDAGAVVIGEPRRLVPDRCPFKAMPTRTSVLRPPSSLR
jgi:hypothetical protein